MCVCGGGVGGSVCGTHLLLLLLVEHFTIGWSLYLCSVRHGIKMKSLN